MGLKGSRPLLTWALWGWGWGESWVGEFFRDGLPGGWGGGGSSVFFDIRIFFDNVFSYVLKLHNILKLFCLYKIYKKRLCLLGQ